MPTSLSHNIIIIIIIIITLQFLTHTTAQPPPLPFTDNSAIVELTIPLNQSETFLINLPTTTTLLHLDWFTTNPTAFPSTLLYLSPTTDSPIRTTGNSLQHNPSSNNYTCTTKTPCATISTIDFPSFFTRALHSHIAYSPPSPQSPSLVYVTVYNYDIQDKDFPSPKQLTGTLFARFLTDPNKQCPVGQTPTHPVCTGHGECKDQKCRCQPPFQGIACERNVIQLPKTNQPPSIIPNITNPQQQSYTARIDLFQSIVFSFQQQNNDDIIFLSVRVLRGFFEDIIGNASQSAPRVIVSSTANDGPLENVLKEHITLPTLASRTFELEAPNPKLRSDPIEKDEFLYVAFYAVPIDEHMIEGHAWLSVNLTTCPETDCGQRSGNPLELALIPAFLITTTVAAIGVLVMLFLDRRHGFTDHIDTLTEAEVERMYPKTNYSGHTLECSICLCEIENGHTVRTLQCSHIYHNQCLDPWLTNNRASCPTCRNDVRIELLSDKRHMRRTVQFFLAPVVAVRRCLNGRRGPLLVEDPPSTTPDLEAGNTNQSLTPQQQQQQQQQLNDDNQNNTASNDTETAHPTT